jgi:hypothetical protein
MEWGELFHYLFGGLLTLAGGGMIVWQALATERAAASRRWPRAPGVVSRAFLDRSESDEGPAYLLKVTCRYRVGDSEYNCDRLRFGIALWSHRSKSSFSRALKKYVVGKSVEVAYNPEKPEESVLEPGFALSLLPGFGFGILVFFMGILMLRP